jgi:uncharacterized membrane protein
MIVLAVLVISTLIFRLIGQFGVRHLSTWKDAARSGLATMLLLTASAHFTEMRHDLVRMIPPVFPAPMMIVYITGVLELAGAIGLLLPWFRRLAGICLALLFAGMFIANIHASQTGVGMAGGPPTPMVIRGPMQVLFIAIALWVSIPKADKPVLRTGTMS